MSWTDQGSYDESPVFFPSGEHTLFGILTSPTGASNGIAVTLCLGGGHQTLANRNRLHVRLARELAAVGYHVLRFDYHGTGESTGLVERFSTDRLFVQDAKAAMGFLRERGFEDHVLCGYCFGARTLLVLAADEPGVRGLAMVSPPLRDLQRGESRAVHKVVHASAWGRLRSLPGLRKLTTSRAFRWIRGESRKRARRLRDRVAARAKEQPSGQGWLSPTFLEPFGRVLGASLPVLLVFGTGDHMYESYQQAVAGELGPILATATPSFELRLVPGVVHGFLSLEAQDATAELVSAWASSLAASIRVGS